ncbi:hypothetical protein [Bailinhaonella thermotolerans]|uniref:hypothetical protein n=1 Tax=Bailinhaonella thermotolerans TaxID=1070861 RepID=UPI0011C3AFA2|nr:hypothetical protein [Bailinhaonella thermotolerans]
MPVRREPGVRAVRRDAGFARPYGVSAGVRAAVRREPGGGVAVRREPGGGVAVRREPGDGVAVRRERRGGWWPAAAEGASGPGGT